MSRKDRPSTLNTVSLRDLGGKNQPQKSVSLPFSSGDPHCCPGHSDYYSCCSAKQAEVPSHVGSAAGKDNAAHHRHFRAPDGIPPDTLRQIRTRHQWISLFQTLPSERRCNGGCKAVGPDHEGEPKALTVGMRSMLFQAVRRLHSCSSIALTSCRQMRTTKSRPCKRLPSKWTSVAHMPRARQGPGLSAATMSLCCPTVCHS